MIYVSPNGISLNRAVEKSRKIPFGEKKEIILAPGDYSNVNLNLDNRDSGLTVSAEKRLDNLRPTFRGGVKINNWEEAENGLFRLQLPSNASEDIRLLEIGGKLRLRSRFPEKGFANHLSKYENKWVSTTGGGFETMPTDTQRSELYYASNEVPLDFCWEDTEITVLHKWDESLVKVAEHDFERRLIKFSGLTGNPPGSFEVQKFCLWNSAYNILHGQWRLDKSAGAVYYRPHPNEDIANSSAWDTWVPTRNSVIEINGPVTNLTIQDINISTTASPLVDIKYVREQIPNTYGALGVTGALEARGGLTNCKFSGINFNNIGGWGIRINDKCKHVIINSCEIKNAGAGGIRMSEGGEGCIVKNNRVANTGLVHYSAVGIYVSGCDIIENSVYNVTYTGISHSKGKGARICRNTVENAVLVLNDGAGIYTTFSENGVMSDNFVKNVPLGIPSQRHGLYIDEQANGWVAEGNIIINCPSALLSHMNYKEGNIIRNNIFASHNGDVKLSFIRCENHKLESNTFHAWGEIIFAGKKGAISLFAQNNMYSASGNVSQFYVNDDYSYTKPVEFNGENILQ
jgi:hypothetical protein